jgi:hypothetical protein
MHAAKEPGCRTLAVAGKVRLGVVLLGAAVVLAATACTDQLDPRIVAYVESVSGTEVCLSSNDRFIEFDLGCYPYESADKGALVAGSCVWVRVPDPIGHDAPHAVAVRDVGELPDRTGLPG